MTEDREEINNLIRHRIKESEETIEYVKLLIENDRLRAAVNRIVVFLVLIVSLVGCRKEEDIDCGYNGETILLLDERESVIFITH